MSGPSDVNEQIDGLIADNLALRTILMVYLDAAFKQHPNGHQAMANFRGSVEAVLDDAIHKSDAPEATDAMRRAALERVEIFFAPLMPGRKGN